MKFAIYHFLQFRIHCINSAKFINYSIIAYLLLQNLLLLDYTIISLSGLPLALKMRHFMSRVYAFN